MMVWLYSEIPTERRHFYTKFSDIFFYSGDCNTSASLTSPNSLIVATPTVPTFKTKRTERDIE